MAAIVVLLIVLILLLAKPQEKRGEALAIYAITAAFGVGFYYACPYLLGLGTILFLWVRHSFGWLGIILCLLNLCLFGLWAMAEFEKRRYRQQ